MLKSSVNPSMLRGRLLTDDLILPEPTGPTSHPMDSSRILLGLMALSRKATEDAPGNEALEGVIAAGVLRSLLSAVHFRDVATVRHSRRVAMLAVGMAQYLGWEGRHLKVLEVAALLHDVGKIGVPDNILFKPGSLSTEEIELMALHHNIGVDVLQACRVDHQVLEFVGHSHTHYSGATDGFRKIGSDVPMGARILAVADAYDSLRTDQFYRKGKSHQEIMHVLMDNAGTQFDGNIVCALSRWGQDAGPPFANQSSNDYTSSAASPGPAHPEDALEASSLCHIFSYLYMLESLYDGFYLVDSDLRIVIWNRGSERLLGYPTQSMLGRVWTSGILGYADQQGKPRPDHECPMHQVVARGRPETSTLHLKHRDGQWKEVETQTVPLLDQSQRLHGVAEIFRDVSRNSRRPQEYRELRMAASRDPLTSVANRGELETQLAMLLRDFAEQPNSEPFSIIFLDADHFKSINDQFGHTVGDAVLIELARLMQHETYSGELVGRYGGEEFVILCPGTGQEDAVKRAERLRHAISKATIRQAEGLRVTASFGVTQVESGDSVESVLRRADKALYMAKENGRNRTCSLTNREMLNGSRSESKQAVEDPFLCQANFLAITAADMVVYKLGGFVSDQKAKLIEVRPERAIIRVGTTGLLGYWGGTDDKRAVEIQLDFGQAELLGRNTNGRVKITVRIRPVGRIKDAEVFQSRARRMLKDLMAFFVADAQ